MKMNSNEEKNLMASCELKRIIRSMSDASNSTLPSSSSSTSPLSLSQSSSLSSIKGHTSANIKSKSEHDTEKTTSILSKLNLNLFNKQQQQQQQDSNNNLETSSTKRNYRYSKEFLTKIREERAAFIDEIYPDIFKAYCYCMNGKYWCPEKYFDVLQYQFPNDFDKIRKQKKYSSMITNNQNQRKSLNYRNNNNNNMRKMNKNRAVSTSGTTMASESQEVKQKSNSSLNIASIENQQMKSDADRILMDLIKPKSQEATNSCENLIDKLLPKSPSKNILDMLNCKKKPETKVNEGVNILNMIKGPQQTSFKRPEFINLNENAQTRQESARRESTGFPMVNPHEKPFQSVNDENSTEKSLNQKLSQLLKLSPQAPAKSQNVIEGLFSKMKSSPSKEETTKEHFNLLLNKLNKPQKSSESSNVMKWFKSMDSNSCKMPQNVLSLKDIETLNA